MKKNLEQTKQTQEALCSAFWDIYENKPLEDITVKEISQHAGYNRSTFYTYYKDIYDILEQTETEIINTFDDDSKWRCNILDKAQYDQDIKDFGSFFQKNRKCLMILLGENGDPKFSHRIWQIMRERLRENISCIMQNVDPEMMDYLVEYILSCHTSIMLMWFKNKCDIPFDRLSEFVHRLLTGGVIPLISGEKDPYDYIVNLILKKIGEHMNENYITEKETKA